MMTKEFARIPFEELSANLEQIFDRVVREKSPIVVEKETGALAVIKPVSVKRPRGKTRRDADAAFRRAFGGWKGIVNARELKKDLAAARGSARPPVRL